MGLSDFRADVATYYDLAPHHPDDVPFYVDRCPTPSCRVLELGCGTGRVSLPLLDHCAVLYGVDHSAGMLDVLRAKTPSASAQRLNLTLASIADFDLGTTFDLVIAPFRVIQNLETEAELTGLFDCVRRHLAPNGRCVLNVFRPNLDRPGMLSSWPSEDERLAWQVETEEGTVSCFDRRVRVQADPLIVYPELIYRRMVGGEVVDEATLRIAMRCFYADEFVERIESAGFLVTDRWGGYAGEPYGEGPELVVEFTRPLFIPETRVGEADV